MSVIDADSLGRAISFATDQIAYSACLALQKSAADGKIAECKDGAGCITFKNDDSSRNWTVPFSIDLTEICTPDPSGDNKNNKECIAKSPMLPMCLPNPDDPADVNHYCQFAPTLGTDVFSGTCLIATEDFCNNLSQLPYTCNSDTCTPKPVSKDPKNPDKPYVEWRADVGCVDNTGCNYPKSSCDTSVNKCRCTSSTDCIGTATCNNGYCLEGGQCVLGNFLLRQYCEEPSSRCVPNPDGSYPDGCKSNGTEPGVTDAPAFHYNKSTGSCSLTADYCERFGKYYSIDTACSVGNDPCPSMSPAGSYECHIPKGSDSGYCSGPSSECYEGSTGKKIAQFFVGSTLFYMFHNGTTCSSVDMQKFSEVIMSRMSQLPEKIQVSIDPEKVLAKKMLKADAVAPGVGIYLIYHKTKKEPTIGVIFSEVNKVFPKNVGYINKELMLTVKKSELQANPALKRLYGFLGMATELRENLFNKK
jgi:hypothetical protein